MGCANASKFPATVAKYIVYEFALVFPFLPLSDETMCVRFAMSVLPPKADMCGATRDVRFGPKADIAKRPSR